jgi:hypothetical protein
MTIMTPEEVSKKIQAAKKRYDLALDRAHGLNSPQEVDETVRELTEAQSEILAALEHHKLSLNENA